VDAVITSTVPDNRWSRIAADLRLSGHAFINGEAVVGVEGRTYEKRSPVDGRVLCRVVEGDAGDVDVAVAAARAAFDRGSWCRRAPRDRKRVMLAYARAIDEARDELAVLATLEMGKPVRDALSEVAAMVEVISYYAEAVDKRYGEVAPTPESALGLVLREPVGVVGAVTPWNYPLNMPAWKLGPALAVGNSVVLKPAEQTPLCAIRRWRSWRPRQACQRASSTSCRASAPPPAPRSVATRTST
jgi:4-guanidinobutyraldehyde dehydrogenase/NAD-dependent aldehyde dehydrogenase